MKKVEKIGADRMRVLKKLLAGGRISERRIYPFPPMRHVVNPENRLAPTKISELVLTDLIQRKLITPAAAINLADPKALDANDYVATPLATKVVRDGGFVYEDVQLTLIEEPEHQTHTSMDE